MSNKSETTMIESIMANYTSVNDTYTTEQVLSITNDLEAAISSVEHSGNGEIPEEQILKLADEALTAEKDNPNHITTQLNLDEIRSYNTGYLKGFLTGYRSSLSEIAALQQENKGLKWELRQLSAHNIDIIKDLKNQRQQLKEKDAVISSLKEQGDGLLTEIREVLESFVSTKTQPVNDYEARIYVNVVREETYKLLAKFPQPPKS